MALPWGSFTRHHEFLRDWDGACLPLAQFKCTRNHCNVIMAYVGDALIEFSFGWINQCFDFLELAFCVFALSEVFQYNSDKHSVNSFYQPSLCRTGCWALRALSDVSHLWPPVFPEQQTAEPLASQGTKAVSVWSVGESGKYKQASCEKD